MKCTPETFVLEIPTLMKGRLFFLQAMSSASHHAGRFRSQHNPAKNGLFVVASLLHYVHCACFCLPNKSKCKVDGGNGESSLCFEKPLYLHLMLRKCSIRASTPRTFWSLIVLYTVPPTCYDKTPGSHHHWQMTPIINGRELGRNKSSFAVLKGYI